MKSKDIKLFDKTIHEVKQVIGDIQKERQSFRNDFVKLRKKHDKKMEKMTSDLLEAIDDMNELYLDMSNETGDENEV